MTDFVHLRVHSKISVGASTVSLAANKKLGITQGIVELCQKNNMTACALTDTNMMSGCAEFSDVMPSNKLQPIIGVEFSLNHHNADPKILRQSSLSKIVLLAKHHKGYLNLCELSRIMYMRQENHHLGPYITMSELKAYKEDLICLSGAHTGAIGMAILNNQNNTAFNLAQQFLDVFGNNFYIEIQNHEIPEQIKILEPLVELARENVQK